MVTLSNNQPPINPTLNVPPVPVETERPESSEGPGMGERQNASSFDLDGFDIVSPQTSEIIED